MDGSIRPPSRASVSRSSRTWSSTIGARRCSRTPRRTGRSSEPIRRGTGTSRRGGGTDMAWSVGAGLDGKGVIVTGAAGGIGRAVATAFSTTGARVLAVDLDQANVDEVVAGLEGSGHLGVAADLRDLATHQGLVDRARSELGNLYVLANLAAVLRRRGSVDEVTE